MSAERCERTDLLVDQCACPLHRGGADPERPAAAGPTFEARHPGHCSACGYAIEPGQPITREIGGGFIHEECA